MIKKAFSFCLLILFLSISSIASLKVGVGKTEITPPLGTPSAGYTQRSGIGMQGVADPLLAIALFIDNEKQSIVLCSVDHLGFTYEMVQKIEQKVRQIPELALCEIYVGASHTHSGGGAHLNIPVLGTALAGAYNSSITSFYIDQAVEAIVKAYHHQVPAKIGIGYGAAEEISVYRGQWPEGIEPLRDIALIKITDEQDRPIAALFNYPIHPTLLKADNRLFSADLIGRTRVHLEQAIGPPVEPLYFNGAQGDILPKVLDKQDHFAACDLLGTSLAAAVKAIWDATETSDTLDIQTKKNSYTFLPQATPFGLFLPLTKYATEINVLVFNQVHAFVTIPGELSCLYDMELKKIGKGLGFEQVSIFGLTNDAHGYIILPESWRHKTYESGLSFGGEEYGEQVKEKAVDLLRSLSPQNKEPCQGKTDAI